MGATLQAVPLWNRQKAKIPAAKVKKPLASL